MKKCKCGSYAINKDRQHFTSSLSNCDLCHWRERADYLELQLVEMLTLITSISCVEPLSFKRVVFEKCDLVANRVEKYHMLEQERASV
jgi:hypothetical protein